MTIHFGDPSGFESQLRAPALNAELVALRMTRLSDRYKKFLAIRVEHTDWQFMLMKEFGIKQGSARQAVSTIMIKLGLFGRIPPRRRHVLLQTGYALYQANKQA